MCLLLPCSVWKQFQLPPRKQTPVRRLQGEKRHKKTMSGGEQWPFMNISDIPQLQTAAGLSIGEVAVPAEGHRRRTLRGATLSPYWLRQRCSGVEPNGKSTLTQASRISTGWDIVQPVNNQACARGEKPFAAMESPIPHTMLAFPVQGACWIFMEGWTEGGVFFFNVPRVFLKIDWKEKQMLHMGFTDGLCFGGR